MKTMPATAVQSTALAPFQRTIGARDVTLYVVTGTDGEPWFRANDVAHALGYSDPKRSVNRHVDPQDKLSHEDLRGADSAPQLNQHERAQSFINESGLYSLIMRSKLREARDFQRWVTSEVLPSIRRTGAYAPPRDPQCWHDRQFRMQALGSAYALSVQINSPIRD